MRSGSRWAGMLSGGIAATGSGHACPVPVEATREQKAIAGSTRKEYAVVAPKAGNPLRSELRVELTLRG